MNQLMTILKKLKSGKRVMIKDIQTRYAILGALNAFQIRATMDGCFIQTFAEGDE